MRNADTVLGIIHERGKQGLPLEDIYRQLYNPHLYTQAYERLRTNKGAMTPGITGETVDGMSLGKIGAIIEAVRHERYRWTPVKRVYIPKKGGKTRPLGLPTWSDKLLQEVMRSILEAYYEPQFSDRSHGFRPNRGCHTALEAIRQTWTGTRWFIEGDIAQCFDRLDHTVLLAILAEQLHDNRFLRLLATMLEAGYLEDWTHHATLSGTPQGGVASPILSNVYLDRLDTFVETALLPQYNCGERRRPHRVYGRIAGRLREARARGDAQRAHELEKQRRLVPYGDPQDPHYRRLTYLRYADDFLLGFIGPKTEAEEIKARLSAYLRDTLKLELSEHKTLITHARSAPAHFLGYEIQSQHSHDKLDHRGRRCVNDIVALRVPGAVVDQHCRRYMRRGEPALRAELCHASTYAIVCKYQTEYRGLVQYYLLAMNVHRLAKLRYVMETSLLKTLAAKHQMTVNAVAHKYSAITETPHGPMTCLRVRIDRGEAKPPLVAQFGGLPLRRGTAHPISDVFPRIWMHRTDLLARLLADTCELCGWKGSCHVHHIRKMADLHQRGRREKPEWMKRMIALRRKTLVVCQPCHATIHAGRLLQPGLKDRSLESRVQ
jgi:group II intron reverse transcriptase/maturase